MASGRYILNGNDLYTVYGAVVEDGSGSFMAFPDRKPSLERDWNDQDGIDIDLLSPKFDAREFKLKCTLLADSSETFWNQYNGLFTELSKPGIHELYVNNLERTYKIFYKKQENLVNATRKVNGSTHIGVKFDLVFGETDWQDNIEKVYLVDDEGRYLIA